MYLFFNMFDCIGIGSFIVAAIGLNTSLGIDSFRWHCFTMPHYPDDHKMWCGNIPPALTMAGFMSIVLHSFGFSIRSFRWHCVFFLCRMLIAPPPPRQFYLGGDRAGCCYRWCGIEYGKGGPGWTLGTITCGSEAVCTGLPLPGGPFLGFRLDF